MTQWLRVAVPGPFETGLDYAYDGKTPLKIGQRVRVPLGKRRHVTGVVLALLRTPSIAPDRLKTITSVLDSEPLFSDNLMQLITWVSAYYHYPIGVCFQAAMPQKIAQGAALEVRPRIEWGITPAGKAALLSSNTQRAKQQHRVLTHLVEAGSALSSSDIRSALGVSTAVVTALHQKGWLEEQTVAALPTASTAPRSVPLALNAAQQTAVKATSPDRFAVYLLAGITGSGKTEVYLQCIERRLAAGRQALVLVPEIALTPQTVARFQARFACPVVTLHSGLNETEKQRHWSWAQTGVARIVIGTRSAVFVPLPDLGIIVVDESHDLSFKQQSSLRYHARDVAIKRAQLTNSPILLGSATPDLETWYQATVTQRYHHLPLPTRAGASKQPIFYVIDVRQQPLYHGLSNALLSACERHLASGGQVLFFLNRRGYAPVLMCHACGWAAKCDHCARYYTVHRQMAGLLCHHCGHQLPLPAACPACQSTSALFQVGVGTERLEKALSERFWGRRVIRIDRTQTARKGVLEDLLSRGHNRSADILIGTQLLAKGHHFEGVTMVAVVDADAGLFSTDFRGVERTAQLILQVAGRAGRAQTQGEVYIQTHQPEHPALTLLLRDGYFSFATQLLAERESAMLPPFGYLVLIRAEARTEATAEAFLKQITTALQACADPALQLLGPVPASSPKKANYYRWQLLLYGKTRGRLQTVLRTHMTTWHAQCPAGVKWSVDVDPQVLSE